MDVDISHAIASRRKELVGESEESLRPSIDATHCKRMIVKSPCFALKVAEVSGQRFFACGTQEGKVFIGHLDTEPTED